MIKMQISFFLVRLLQNFSSVSLAEDAQTSPPDEWKLDGGRKAEERVWPKAHLTMYAHVSGSGLLAPMLV
jgi:hypothetical protein